MKYPNGYSLQVRFFELGSAEESARRYSTSQVESLLESGIRFPLITVEVHNNVAGISIRFGSGRLGPTLASGMVSTGGMIVLSIGPPNNVPFDQAITLDPSKHWTHNPDRYAENSS